MEDTLPLVSIITINYNKIDLTIQLLSSLEKTQYSNIEVIVVDNDSEENPEFKIREQFPHIVFIRSDYNRGFAGANNLGAHLARGKYLLFLNNDTEVAPDFLFPLVSKLESAPDIGMASPKIIYHGTDNIIQFAGATNINKFTGRGRKIGHFEKDLGQYDEDRETQLAHGAAMIIPASIITKVGPMPEVYFLYYEEHDWCEMIKRAGYKIYYVGGSRVYHKESMSIGKENKLKTYYLSRNRLLFMRRNTSGVDLWIGYLFFTFFSLPKNALKYIVQFKLNHLMAFCKGILWNFKSQPTP